MLFRKKNKLFIEATDSVKLMKIYLLPVQCTIICFALFIISRVRSGVHRFVVTHSQNNERQESRQNS